MTPVDAILARLLELHPKKIDLSLERMWRILERLDHPERKVPTYEEFFEQCQQARYKNGGNRGCC